MRRISLALALVCAVAAAGCSGGAKRSSDAGGSPGVSEGRFKVTVQNTAPLDIKGGKVTSAPQGIDCGIGSAGVCSFEFPLGTSVVLTAVANGLPSTDKDANGVALPYKFFGWAGDCTGEGTCTLTGNADKYVVATFAGKQTGHANFSDPKVHAAAYAEGALVCTSCHGGTLQGQGIAVACNLCHAMPPVTAQPQPTVVFTAASPLTGTVGDVLQPSALATDPSGNIVTCTWSLFQKPEGSAASVAAGPVPCSTTPGTTSFTPDVAGTYVVRVKPSNQTGTADSTIVIAAQAFGGGAVATTEATAGAELTAIATQLGKASAQHGGWMTAANLAKSLLGLDAANPKGTYLLVDIRDPEDFALSHAVGAVNVPFAQLPDVLLANPLFPQAADTTPGALKKLAVLGYYGGDGIQASLLFTAARLGAIGESATLAANQKTWGVQFGQTSWSFDKPGAPCRYDDDLNIRKLELVPELQTSWPTTTNTSWLVKPPVGTTYSAPPATNNVPSISAFTGTSTATQKILVRAKQYVAWMEADAAAKGVPRQERFQADWVRYDRLVKAGVAANIPQIVSVQSPTGNGWQGGHAKGAILGNAGVINGNATTPAALSFVKQLDPAKEVWVHCFTGTSAAAPTAVLGILGYKSRNILYGNAGYTRDTTTGANAAIFDYDTTAFANDFPLATGTSPGCDLLSAAGSCVAYTPSRNGCKECHTNYAAHFADVTVKPIPGAIVEVASEGEG